jgi:hypothetical protein
VPASVKGIDLIEPSFTAEIVEYLIRLNCQERLFGCQVLLYLISIQQLFAYKESAKQMLTNRPYITPYEVLIIGYARPFCISPPNFLGQNILKR